MFDDDYLFELELADMYGEFPEPSEDDCGCTNIFICRLHWREW